MSLNARVIPTLLALLIIASVFVPTLEASHLQNDAGSGGDAGNTFETATEVARSGTFSGVLDRSGGDAKDYYKFWMNQGEPLSIDVHAGLTTGFIQVNDAEDRPGVALLSPHGLLLDTPNSNVGDSRVTMSAAPVSGAYRLVFDSDFLRVTNYRFCFVTSAGACETEGIRPMGIGTPLPYPFANVLLLPPMNGNPFGTETPLDYVDAILRGIRAWEPALAAFAADFPQFSYVTDLSMRVEVYDGTPERAGYDVIVGWSPYTGPQFRGVAITTLGPSAGYTMWCDFFPEVEQCDTYKSLEPLMHDSTRLIIMSLFANSPRAGQVVSDWPEVNDVENVAMHEIAHTWGLGHTLTYTSAHRADLMNSPYTEVFGDGNPLGDGGERTPVECISSLDAYGLAYLYRWLPSGEFQYPGTNSVNRPFITQGDHAGSIMPYKLYC